MKIEGICYGVMLRDNVLDVALDSNMKNMENLAKLGNTKANCRQFYYYFQKFFKVIENHI